MSLNNLTLAFNQTFIMACQGENCSLLVREEKKERKEEKDIEPIPEEEEEDEEYDEEEEEEEDEEYSPIQIDLNVRYPPSKTAEPSPSRAQWFLIGAASFAGGLSALTGVGAIALTVLAHFA